MKGCTDSPDMPFTDHRDLNPPGSAHRAAKEGVRLDNVTLQRGLTDVFAGLTLELKERRIGLIGDNGAGKTSLFRLICGLDRPQSGRVTVAGVEPGNGQHLVGMMFQNPDEQIIFPTVQEELALGLQAQGLTRKAAQERARAWLQARGLGAWAERAVSSLSQGQRQQVCWLALNIAMPQVLLLDEPFASLDLPGQARLAREIEAAEPQVVVSTHLLAHIEGFERVIWLERGRVRADGPGREVCAAYAADVAARVSSDGLSAKSVQR